jgi:hypothetical protein
MLMMETLLFKATKSFLSRLIQKRLRCKWKGKQFSDDEMLTFDDVSTCKCVSLVFQIYKSDTNIFEKALFCTLGCRCAKNQVNIF